MDLQWTHALPIGILMSLGTAFRVTRGRLARARAERNYPALAEELGLSYEAPRYAGMAGTLRGTFEGFEVLVQSEERCRIVVYLPNRAVIELRSYDHHKRAPEGWVTFSLGRRELDSWLPNRYCRPEVAARCAEGPALAQALDALRRDADRVKQLTLDEQRLECVLDSGSPAVLSPARVRTLLPRCVRIARALQECGA